MLPLALFVLLLYVELLMEKKFSNGKKAVGFSSLHVCDVGGFTLWVSICINAGISARTGLVFTHIIAWFGGCSLTDTSMMMIFQSSSRYIIAYLPPLWIRFENSFWLIEFTSPNKGISMIELFFVHYLLR